MFKLEESEGSRRGQTYQAAAKGGKPVVNEGQKTVKFMTEEGQKKKVVCQVAAVNKILASIAGMCDKGNYVVFRHDGGDIISTATGKKTPFRRVGNVYVLDAWVLNPKWKESSEDRKVEEEVMGFTGPVASR